jgi:hypothetical protein
MACTPAATCITACRISNEEAEHPAQQGIHDNHKQQEQHPPKSTTINNPMTEMSLGAAYKQQNKHNQPLHKLQQLSKSAHQSATMESMTSLTQELQQGSVVSNHINQVGVREESQHARKAFTSSKPPEAINSSKLKL